MKDVLFEVVTLSLLAQHRCLNEVIIRKLLSGNLSVAENVAFLVFYQKLKLL